MVNWGLSLFVG